MERETAKSVVVNPRRIHNLLEPTCVPAVALTHRVAIHADDDLLSWTSLRWVAAVYF